MNIPDFISLIETQTGILPRVTISLDHTFGSRIVSGISLNGDTTIDRITFDIIHKNFRVNLVHNNCYRYKQTTIIESVPYYCKYCGVEVLSEKNAIDLGLPINTKKAQLEVKIAGKNGNSHLPPDSFEVFNLQLHRGQWWHTCSARNDITRNRRSRMTIKEFPHKCKHCKMILGDKEFNVNKAFKLPILMGKK